MRTNLTVGRFNLNLNKAVLTLGVLGGLAVAATAVGMLSTRGGGSPSLEGLAVSADVATPPAAAAPIAVSPPSNGFALTAVGSASSNPQGQGSYGTVQVQGSTVTYSNPEGQELWTANLANGLEDTVRKMGFRRSVAGDDFEAQSGLVVEQKSYVIAIGQMKEGIFKYTPVASNVSLFDSNSGDIIGEVYWNYGIISDHTMINGAENGRSYVVIAGGTLEAQIINQSQGLSKIRFVPFIAALEVTDEGLELKSYNHVNDLANTASLTRSKINNAPENLRVNTFTGGIVSLGFELAGEHYDVPLLDLLNLGRYEPIFRD